MSSLTPLVPSPPQRARRPSSAWQQALRYAVRDLGELAELLELPRETLFEGAGASADFPLLVPRGFVARMRKGDPADPLIPNEQGDQIEAELQKQQISHRVFRYDGTDHGFFCDRRASYNPTAAADAWNQVLTLFSETLKSP